MTSTLHVCSPDYIFDVNKSYVFSPELTWRDLQHIVVLTAKIPNSIEKGWTINGAGNSQLNN